MKYEFCVDLTDKQVSSFWEQGFLTLERITTHSEIESLKQDYDSIIELIYNPEKVAELAEKHELPLDGGRALFIWVPFPGIIIPHLQNTNYVNNAIKIAKHLLKGQEKLKDTDYCNNVIKLAACLLKAQEKLKDTSYFKNVIKIAARLLNVQETQVIGEGRIFFKPAQFGSPIPWHQDGTHLACRDILKIWMPLDPVDEENGCMQFIKYSHRRLRRYHPYQGDPTGSFMKTDDDEIELSNKIVCQLPAGGATIHHRLTLHHSGPNRTNMPRRALVIVCTVADTNQDSLAHTFLQAIK